MRFCGFCGKGPFTTSSGLNRHIGRSVNCNKAKRQEWGLYATNIWDNAPGDSDKVLQPPASPRILENEDIANQPDTTLEDDLQALENIADTALAPEMPPNEPPNEPEDHRATVDEADDEASEESAYYIEDFPPNLGAGAVWGEDIPFFEKLRQEQVQNETSRWGPFEDHDEWELAKWLIRNTGHNQTNAFLNLNIVSSHLFYKISDINDCIDRCRNEPSHRITTTGLFLRRSMPSRHKGRQVGLVMSLRQRVMFSTMMGNLCQQRSLSCGDEILSNVLENYWEIRHSKIT
jgi:hypothetical protein